MYWKLLQGHASRAIRNEMLPYTISYGLSLVVKLNCSENSHKLQQLILTYNC